MDDKWQKLEDLAVVTDRASRVRTIREELICDLCIGC